MIHKRNSQTNYSHWKAFKKAQLRRREIQEIIMASAETFLSDESGLDLSASTIRGHSVI